jgi:hypothetical protein
MPCAWVFALSTILDSRRRLPSATAPPARTVPRRGPQRVRGAARRAHRRVSGISGPARPRRIARGAHKRLLRPFDERKAAAAGQQREAGAMRIPKGHELTRRYIAEFGVPTRKFVHWNDQAYYFARGERRRIADVKGLYPRYQLREQERLMKARTNSGPPPSPSPRGRHRLADAVRFALSESFRNCPCELRGIVSPFC